MRRTNRHLFRPIRRLSAGFLRAMIAEWWFPMHLDKTLTLLQWTVPLLELAPNLMTRELENDSASLRCTATSIVIDNRHRQFVSRGVGSRSQHELVSRGRRRASGYPEQVRIPNDLFTNKSKRYRYGLERRPCSREYGYAAMSTQCRFLTRRGLGSHRTRGPLLRSPMQN